MVALSMETAKSSDLHLELGKGKLCECHYTNRSQLRHTKDLIVVMSGFCDIISLHDIAEDIALVLHTKTKNHALLAMFWLDFVTLHASMPLKLCSKAIPLHKPQRTTDLFLLLHARVSS